MQPAMLAASRAWIQATCCRGFTLVELLVVVIILGALAAVAIPMFSTSSEDARRAALDQDVVILNDTIERYYLEHGARYPGTLDGKTNWETFVQQLTTRTDKSGAKGERYGPYLKTGIPVNPYTGTNTGSVGKGMDLTGTLAWRYDPATGILAAANDGTNGGGRGIEPDPEPKGD